MRRHPSRNADRTRLREEMQAFPFYFSTRFFLLFAGVTVCLIPTYFLDPCGIFLPLAVDFALIVAALVDYRAAGSAGGIGVQRPLPHPLATGKPNEIFLEVWNRSGRAIPMILRDDVPPRSVPDPMPVRTNVAPGGNFRVSYRLTPLERGNGEFGNVHFWWQGPLGLVWKRGHTPGRTTVKLYPGLALIEERKLRLWRPMVQDAVRARWSKGVGTEFDSLREYVVGDDTRLIHWSTSARKGKPILRQNRIEQSQTVFIVLDAGRMMTARVLGRTKMDYGLDAALLLAYSALELGDMVGVMVVAGEILCFLPPSHVPGQFGKILDAAYAIEPRMEEPRFHLALSGLAGKLKRRSLVILLTHLIDERSSEGLIRCSLGLRPRHLPLVVAMSDTEVGALADSAPRTRDDLYRQGVAAGILYRRERLMARLGSAGVMVLDTPPDRISVDVLERYLEIKMKSRL